MRMSSAGGVMARAHCIHETSTFRMLLAKVVTIRFVAEAVRKT
jgi:hypothetical protein